MALILCIESATKSCSVALSLDGELLHFKEEISDKYSHSEQLTVFIEEMLKEKNLSISDLSAVAVSKGPGSYTGLRIGVSTAKGICYALGKPLISVPTLESMAYGMSIAMPNKTYCPMIDARRMEVYCAFFSSNSSPSETKAVVIDSDSFFSKLNMDEIVFFGDGADKCQDVIKHENAVFKLNRYPSAKDMVAISHDLYLVGKFEDLAYFEPYYLKDFIAGVAKK